MVAPDLHDAVEAAQTLLGWKLVHQSPEGITSGYIVETEAYHMHDEASHSFQGPTKRADVMFGPAGRLYVYFTYGMHYCMNIVTGDEGDGQAVLIRALQPVDGIEMMARRRGRTDHLTDGPGKLTQAMGIGLMQNGEEIDNVNIRLEKGITPKDITSTTRIGIKKAADKPWRFYITDNPFVSKR